MSRKEFWNLFKVYFPVALCATVIGFFYCLQWQTHEKHNQELSAIVDRIDDLQYKQDSLFSTLSDSLFSKDMDLLQANRLQLQEEKFKAHIGIEKQKLFEQFVAFAGIGSLAGVVAFFLLIPKEIHRRSKQEIDAQIADLVLGRKKEFGRMLQRYSEEVRLKQNLKIGVHCELSPALLDILRNEYDLSVEVVDIYQKSDCQIFIINNKNGQLGPIYKTKQDSDEMDSSKQPNEQEVSDKWQKLANRISINDNRCYFYYGKFFPLDILNDVEDQVRVSFANSPAQIYPNLLNLMKYQDKLSK
jgi:hypothetical protein